MSAHRHSLPGGAGNTVQAATQLHEGQIRGALEAVYGAKARSINYTVGAVESMPDFGGRAVDIYSLYGRLGIHEPDGQILSGVIKDVGISDVVAAEDVARANAAAFANRIFPWVAILDPPTVELVDRGSTRTYELKWGSVKDGIEMPSWVRVTTTSAGVVTSFAANHVPDVVAVPPRVPRDQAAQSALRDAPGWSVVAVNLRMAKVLERLHTLWIVVIQSPPPGSHFDGMASFSERTILIDATSGELLRENDSTF